MSVTAISYDACMGRWEPNAGERLRQAAMELFHERGYDRTTVEEIAARAGLTERTFFRYFTDKREVLFAGSESLAQLIIDTIKAAPTTTAPFDAVVAALEATSTFFEGRHSHAQKRQALIVAHAELLERELIKLTLLGVAISETLQKRGVARPTARLVGEMGMTIFRNAFERWLEDGKKRDLAHHIHATLAELRTAAAS